MFGIVFSSQLGIGWLGNGACNLAKRHIAVLHQTSNFPECRFLHAVKIIAYEN